MPEHFGLEEEDDYEADHIAQWAAVVKRWASKQGQKAEDAIEQLIERWVARVDGAAAEDYTLPGPEANPHGHIEAYQLALQMIATALEVDYDELADWPTIIPAFERKLLVAAPFNDSIDGAVEDVVIDYLGALQALERELS